MAFLEFSDSYERIGRAESHRRTLAKLWSEFLEGEPYSPGVEVDETGKGQIWITQRYDSMPSVFGLLFGEILYHLRAALDSCIYGAAILESGQNPPPDAGRLEFPIRDSAEAFEKAAWKISPLNEERRRIVESFQIFNASAVHEKEVWVLYYLHMLNELARRDRHRRLRVVGSWASEAKPRLRLPDGVEILRLQVHSNCFLREDTVVAEFELGGWKPSMRIEANPDLAIDIALDESAPGYEGPHPLGRTVPNLVRAVRTVRERLEASFYLERRNPK